MGRGFLFLASSIVLAVLPLAAWQHPVPKTGTPASVIPTAEEIRSTLKELSEITGFRIRRQLPFELVTRDQVNQYLEGRIRKTVKPDEIRAEELTLKKFGFVSNDFDLKKTTIDLLTEQAAAFYDYDRKKLFISDWATKNMRDAALIHELAHALADQNYSISKFLKNGSKSSEESAAREAVVEGQASWLMLEVAARRAGTTLGNPDIARQYLRDQSDDAPGEYPVFDKAPLYLQRTLIFPYDEGMKFQQAVFAKDGNDAFGELFRHSPSSTSQIIHADRYFARAPFTMPALPKPAKRSKPFTAGTLGELETAVLLEQFAGKEAAVKLSPKLRGAAYRIDETKREKHSTLVYVSEWSDEEASKAFFLDYEVVLSKKWHRFEVLSREVNRLTGNSEDGYFELVRDGVKVSSREGFGESFANVITVRRRRPEFTPHEVAFTWHRACTLHSRGA